MSPVPYTSETVASPRPAPAPGSRSRVILQACIKQVILPDAVDAKILTSKALALEAGFLQQPDRRDIVRNACRFDPMQLQGPECEWDDGVDRRGHVTSARKGRPHPITEAARLGTTAADVGEREPPDKNIVLLAENEERIGEVAALVLGIPLDATAKRVAREVVRRPGRLPWREEVTAGFPQCSPFPLIGHPRRPQHDTVACNRRHLLGQADGAEEGHGDLRRQAAADRDGCFPLPEFRRPSSLVGPPISSRPADKTVGDRSTPFKPGTRAERRAVGPPAGDQGAPGG